MQNEQGELIEQREPADFIVNDGSVEPLLEKGIFFLRNVKPGSAINPQGSNDE